MILWLGSASNSLRPQDIGGIVGYFSAMKNLLLVKLINIIFYNFYIWLGAVHER